MMFTPGASYGPKAFPSGRTPPLGKPKPKYEYTFSDKIDPPESWQREDIDFVVDRMIEYRGSELEKLKKVATGGSANWSEMGAKKTSTGLWAIQRITAELLDNKPNPSLLIVTTRSGKGTFFQLAPHILEGWTILNVSSGGISIVINGEEQLLPKSKLPFIPRDIDFPCIVVTHYHTFSRSNKGKFKADPKTGHALRDEKGAIIMEDLTPADHLMAREWDFFWADEAHRLKDKDAKWTKTLVRVKADYRMVTTGTGFINRPNEIWQPLNIIDKKTFPSYWGFYERYCDFDVSSGYSRVIGVKPEHKDEFREVVRHYGPRRTLNEVMPHIKYPIFVEHKVELNKTQRKMYDQIKTELRALDKNNVPIHAANVLTLLQRLRAICVATPEVVADYYDEDLGRRVQKIKLTEPSSKLDAVQEIIEGLEWDEERKSPVVVFSNFVGPLLLLEARFNKANESCAMMDIPPEFPYLWLKQSDNDQTRYEKWAKLFPSGDYRVFMSTLQLGGESINLTSARHVIFLDRSWSPKDNMQGIGRIRRPGQEGQPLVININAINTTDSYIKEVNLIKQSWFDTIFADED